MGASDYWHVSPKSNRASIEEHGIRGEETTEGNAPEVWVHTRRPAEVSEHSDLWHIQGPYEAEHGASAEWNEGDAAAAIYQDIHPAHIRREGAVLTDWMPTERLFAPTKAEVDPRLFDTEERMRPAVRKAILDSIDHQWAQHNDWRSWAKVYLAGSEASKWWGNNDFDLLVGVDYDAFREHNPKYRGFTNKEITDGFNRGFAATFNNEEWHPPFDRKGVWHRTGYVNMNSYDIRAIKPYAAYDVTTDSWAVRPVEEPEGHKFDQSLLYYAEGVAEQIKNVLRLPEPARSQQATRLWRFLHEDRSRAFGPQGTGLYDRGNMVEKYLDQAGLWQQLVDLRFGKTAALTPQEGGYNAGHGEGREPHVGGKKRKSDQSRGVGGAAEQSSGGVESADAGGGASALGPARQVVEHGQLKKDLKGLQQRLRPKYEKIIAGLANNEPHPSTHPLTGKLKGWQGTNLDFNHRIVHRYVGDDELHIGHVGIHYEGAENRLGSRYEGEQDLKKRMDAEKALRAHLAEAHPDLADPGKGHAVLDMYHRLAHGTVGPQQQLDPNDHPHDSLITPRLPFSQRHPQTKRVHTVLDKTASDWHAFDTNRHYRRGHQDGAQGVYDQDHDTLSAKVDMGIPLEPHEVDYMAGHAAGTARARDLAAGHHRMKQVWEEHGQPYGKEARVKVVPSDGDDSKQGIMIAVAPPARIIENLVLEEGETAENLHITIAYLGDLDSHSEAQIDMLPELIAAWAEGEKKLDAKVQGAGTFVNEGNHVLWASVDAPGINEMHVSLVQFLTGHGFEVRKDHSFTPHITLAYGKHHFRFMPKIEPTEWKVREVWCCIGGRWESFPLRGR